MLEQINTARNIGNANAALARSNFARADQISIEFISRLIRLSGEDFNGALVDSTFNEDAAVAFVDSMLEEIDRAGLADASPAQLAHGFQTILEHVLTAPTVLENRHAEDATGLDDFYAEDNDNNIRKPSTNADNDAEPNLHQHPDALIDIEAAEVPAGEESDRDEPEESSGDDNSKDEDGEDS